MRFYLALVLMFCGVILSTVPLRAGEVHCSLNDGMMADGKTALEYGGAKHQFCCSECLDKFKANPEAFSNPLQSSATAETSCTSVCSK